MPTIDTQTTKISVVMPCYNEGSTVLRMIESTAKILRKKYGESFEIITVNDGSKDNTGKFLAIASIRDKQVKIVDYGKNKGKGYALRAGFKEACGEVVVFIDSDLEIPPQLIPQYVDKLHQENLDCVVASKIHRRSIVNQNFRRKCLSYASRKFIEVLFQLKNIDTQVGLKVFRREALSQIEDKLRSNSFAFDIELLVLLREQHFHIATAPVYINQDDTCSKVNPSSVAKTFLDTMRIHRRLHRSVRNHSMAYGIVRYAMLGLLLLPMEFLMKIGGEA